VPGIRVLIAHVDLVDPEHLRSEIRPDLSYPITLALADYGDAAIPQIVDAYLSERDQTRKGLLAYAIRYGDRGRHGERVKVALRYLRGTEPPTKEEWLKAQNMKSLEERLKHLTEIVVAPDHDKK
jgi:hypothetical protein